MLKLWFRLFVLFWALIILWSSGPISAQDDYGWQVFTPENVAEYRPLTTIPRDSFLIQYQPEYFAFSPDGTQIAAAATDATVNVWDVETSVVRHVLDHDSISVSWRPDGAWIGTGGSEWTARIWDADTGQLRYDLGEGGGWYIGWSADSTRFVTNSGKIFNTETGELVSEIGFNWGVPYEVEWSPDGTMIASASGWEGNETQLWSATGEHLDTFWTYHSISWSPDSARLASFGQVRDVTTGLPETIIPEMYGEIAWHPGGYVFSGVGEARLNGIESSVWTRPSSHHPRA